MGGKEAIAFPLPLRGWEGLPPEKNSCANCYIIAFIFLARVHAYIKVENRCYKCYFGG